jgi:magnesium chelatase subunit D
MRERYPFSALVGQDDLKTVLILNAIYPAIGGVLIRGEKGTAKSTAARGLARLLPSIQVIAGDPYNRPPDALDDYPGEVPADVSITEIPAPFVDLPIGATEDRVLGSLDFQAALKTGERVFHPGLLAAANRGILYIDEVNLLPAHLVDVLLDAAAMGVNTIQREGITLTHPAQFILIGTMNPEEGDLRPQLMDRFGLVVDVTAPRDPALRTEVVRRRIAFESDPAAFVAAWANEETALKKHIQQAKARLPRVTLDDEMLMLISRICTAFDVDGLRADITLHKAARALAAWEQRDIVTAEDVRRAAEWVLPHRRRRQPFEPPEIDRDKLDDLIDQPPAAESDDLPGEDDAPPGGDSDDSVQTFTASKPEQIKRLRLSGRTQGEPSSGRRNPMQGAKRGHYTRSRQDDSPDDPALDATLRAAAPNGTDSRGKPIVHPDNLRQKVRTSTTDTLILFVVDASGSMAARARMEAVKGAVLALLTDAYQQRDQVGVIAFRGTNAELILAPTRSVELAEKRLQHLPTGGRTPLAHALLLAHETVYRVRRDHPEQAVLLVLLSDGKANVPLSNSGGDPWKQTQAAAAKLATLAVPALLLDTETGYVRVGRGRELAKALGADYMPLDDLSADTLIHKIRARQH